MGWKACFGNLSDSAEFKLKPGFNLGSKAWYSDAQLREETLSLLDLLLDFGPATRK
jgi:hypothetical protein